MEKPSKEKQYNWTTALIAGVVFAVIAQVIHMVEAWLTLDYYMDPYLYPFWSRFMMPGETAPPMEFFVMSILINIFIGMLIAYVYFIVKSAIRAEKECMRGVKYGIYLWFVAGIPSFFSLFLILNLPFGLIFAWLISGLAIYVLNGAALSKIVR